jgi:4-nitrophenyl phosphatase
MKLTNLNEYASVIAKYDTFMFDCDGVLWNGDKLVEGVTKVLDYLRRQSGFAYSLSWWRMI